MAQDNNPVSIASGEWPVHTEQTTPWPLCYETNNYSPTLASLFATPLEIFPSLEEQFYAASLQGFRYVGLDSGSLHSFLQHATVGEIQLLLLEHELKCLEVTDISIGENERATLQAARPLVDLANKIDAQFIQVSVFGDLNAAAQSARAVEALLTDSSVKLALEFLPFSPINSIAMAQQFIREAGLQRTRIVLDSWHFFLGPDQWMELANLNPSELAYVQFCDHGRELSDDLLSETVNNRVLPGEGCFDLERFCRQIKQIGFQGPISVEVLSNTLRQWPPRTFAGAEYRSARQFWP